MSTPKFDALAFLHEHWPTVEDLAAFLKTYDVEAISLYGMKQWYRRETIPADWLPVLLALLELEKGAPVSIAKHLK